MIYNTDQALWDSQHSHCTCFNVEIGPEPDDLTYPPDAATDAWNAESGKAEEDLIEAARDAMDWIYSQLEKEYEYQNSDEQVADTIRANEYEFTEEGERA